MERSVRGLPTLKAGVIYTGLERTSSSLKSFVLRTNLLLALESKLDLLAKSAKRVSIAP